MDLNRERLGKMLMVLLVFAVISLLPLFSYSKETVIFSFLPSVVSIILISWLCFKTVDPVSENILTGGALFIPIIVILGIFTDFTLGFGESGFEIFILSIFIGIPIIAGLRLFQLYRSGDEPPFGEKNKLHTFRKYVSINLWIVYVVIFHLSSLVTFMMS